MTQSAELVPGLSPLRLFYMDYGDTWGCRFECPCGFKAQWCGDTDWFNAEYRRIAEEHTDHDPTRFVSPATGQYAWKIPPLPSP